MRNGMNTKKKSKKRTPIVLSIIVISLVLSYLTYYNNAYIESVIRDILYYPVVKLAKDSEVLVSTIDEELKKENKELRGLLDLEESISEFQYINATVITRNTNSFLSFFVINKGSNSGIAKGMAVITNGGLIGVIDSIGSNTSVVKMITDSDSRNKVSVKIVSGDSTVTTVMAVDESGRMVATGIKKNIDVKVGDKVITSGLSDIFPSGLLIGYVDNVFDDNYMISKNVSVKLSSDIFDIRYVAVIKRGSYD